MKVCKYFFKTYDLKTVVSIFFTIATMKYEEKEFISH